MAHDRTPETLERLAQKLAAVGHPEANALAAHARAWSEERERLSEAMERVAEAEARVELLEGERQWAQDNYIKRRKRAANRPLRPGR